MSPRPRSFPARVACVGSLVVALAGITASGAGAAETSPPKAWAKTVCTALGSWASGLNTASNTVTVDAASAPDDIKAALTKLLKRAQRDTRRLTRALDAAGAPEVKHGTKIAAALREDIAGVPSAITAARKDLTALATDDAAAFTTGASTAYASVTTALDAVPIAMDEGSDLYSSAPLQKAFRATRACRTLVNP